MSHLAAVIDLYLYDLDVPDELFRRFVLEAVEQDAGTVNAPGAQRLARELRERFSVKV